MTEHRIERVFLWAVAGALVGAVVGAVAAIVSTGWSEIVSLKDASGSWRFALERAGVDAGAGIGALFGFAAVLSYLAWRIVVGGVVGVTLGAVAGMVIGDALSRDDFSAPVDWSALAGLLIGGAVGGVTGFVLGTILHVRHERRPAQVGRRRLEGA